MVIVKEASDDKYIGVLDNEPFIKGCLNVGDEIKFNYKNVLEIYKDDEK